MRTPDASPAPAPPPAHDDTGNAAGGATTSSGPPVGRLGPKVKRTAEERKQRRLETNRLAAKRAYYRRQGKANAMKDENDRLKMLVEKYGACGPNAS